MFFTIYERNMTSIAFIRKNKVISGINFDKNYIKLNFSNIFNLKELKDIEKFEKYIFNHLNKIKSNILKSDKLDAYLVSLSIENYIKTYKPFYPQTIFNKTDIIKYLNNYPNILQNKYNEFVNNSDNELYNELLNELLDFVGESTIFIKETYYEYDENKDYYDQLINSLDIICKNEDLIHFMMFGYLNNIYLNFIEDILYPLVFKNKKSEVFIKQLLQTKNINLILLLINTIFSDIDIDEPLTGRHKKHIEAIQQYLSSYKIEVSKLYRYEDCLSFLKIDYKIIDGSESKLILK